MRDGFGTALSSSSSFAARCSAKQAADAFPGCSRAVAGDGDLSGGVALLQRDAGRRLREAPPQQPFPFAPALGRDAAALAGDVGRRWAPRGAAEAPALAEASAEARLALPFPFAPALGSDAAALAARAQARSSEESPEALVDAGLEERPADEVREALMQKVSGLSAAKAAPTAAARATAPTRHAGAGLAQGSAAAAAHHGSGAAALRSGGGRTAGKGKAAASSPRSVARPSSTVEVGRQTRRLLPALIVAGLAGTILVFILLILHQRFYQGNAATGGSAGHKLEAAWTTQAKTREVAQSSASRQAKDRRVLVDRLIVPDRKRLVVLLERRLYRERQNVGFDITSGHHRGRSQLMKVRALEVSQEGAARVQLEVADQTSSEVLACFTTEELWEERPGATPDDEVSVSLYGAGGAVFGRFISVPTERGVMYQVFAEPVRMDSPLYTFTGDFAEHSIRVTERGLDGRLVASSESQDEDVAQVKMEPGADAGVILLGLLAIDKIQRYRQGRTPASTFSMPVFAGGAPPAEKSPRA